MSGYSGTPLARKLGIEEGYAVAAVGDVPDDLADLLAPLPPGVRWKKAARRPVDIVIAFFTRRADVARRWTGLTAAAGPEGVVWVAWPKRSSGVPTDLTEDTFREDLLPTGWVDVKVCAIDETWSGLKMVMRKELRPTRSQELSRPSRGST
jgi:hypothetical protein